MIFETKNCTGCKTCEIACSFHHQKGIFSTATASMTSVENQEGLSFSLLLHEKGGSHPVCDRCSGEKEPLCIKYCPVVMRDELKGIIEGFWKKHI